MESASKLAEVSFVALIDMHSIKTDFEQIGIDQDPKKSPYSDKVRKKFNNLK